MFGEYIHVWSRRFGTSTINQFDIGSVWLILPNISRFSGKPRGTYGFVDPKYQANIAMENGHRNSEFSHKKNVIFSSYAELPEGRFPLQQSAGIQVSAPPPMHFLIQIISEFQVKHRYKDDTNIYVLLYVHICKNIWFICI